MLVGWMWLWEYLCICKFLRCLHPCHFIADFFYGVYETPNIASYVV